MAAARENGDIRENRRKAIDRERTLVVIAGRASHFKPIRETIWRELDNLNIPEGHRIFLPGDKAKEACCKGAVMFKRSFDFWGNPTEILGTYGFISEAGSPNDVFRIMDTRNLNDGEIVNVEFKSFSTYWLFFSTKAKHTLNDQNKPAFFDGYTALIKDFDNNEFKVKYDNKSHSFIINNMGGFKLSNYGGIYESIYPKVWPLALKPKKN
jgi:hypothetical protein